MGVPYSKEIDYAFEHLGPLVAKGHQVLDSASVQITPLAATGIQVLDTTRSIAIVLFWLQLLSTLAVVLNLVCLVGILITLNPDLEEERRTLVTPVVRWVLRVMWWVVKVPMWVAVLLVHLLRVLGAVAWNWLLQVEESNGEEGGGGGGGSGSGKDKRHGRVVEKDEWMNEKKREKDGKDA